MGVARTGVRFEQFAGYPGWILEPRLLWHKVKRRRDQDHQAANSLGMI